MHFFFIAYSELSASKSARDIGQTFHTFMRGREPARYFNARRWFFTVVLFLRIVKNVHARAEDGFQMRVFVLIFCGSYRRAKKLRQKRCKNESQTYKQYRRERDTKKGETITRLLRF